MNMRTHLPSVAEENKLSDGSGNVCMCENPQAVAGAGKKPVCVKAALDQLLDGCRVQTHVKINALCLAAVTARTASMGKQSGRMLHLLCHQGQLGTVLLAAGLSSRVPLARLKFTSRHHRQARLLWCRERVH